MSDAIFDAWKAKALEADLLVEAQARGAKLRRCGAELVGPCPAGCGSKDTFAIHPAKGIFVCRKGGVGGDVIAMVRHLDGVDFLGACERLTGEPPPRGRSHEISAEERAALERRRQEAERKALERAEQEERRRSRRATTALGIWAEGVPIADTLAERYLVNRGIPVPPQGWPPVLGFHPEVEWELGRDGDRAGPVLPCLLALVQDLAGKPTGIWRIFLAEPGKKAAVEPNKVGMGSVQGGAVRLGGDGPEVGVAEGIETALAVWTLERYRMPVWSCLSTAGMAGFEPPIFVRKVVTFPDGDRARFKKTGGVLEPPGMKAARALKARLEPAGIPNPITPPPTDGSDFLDVLRSIPNDAA